MAETSGAQESQDSAEQLASSSAPTQDQQSVTGSMQATMVALTERMQRLEQQPCSHCRQVEASAADSIARLTSELEKAQQRISDLEERSATLEAQVAALSAQAPTQEAQATASASTNLAEEEEAGPVMQPSATNNGQEDAQEQEAASSSGAAAAHPAMPASITTSTADFPQMHTAHGGQVEAENRQEAGSSSGSAAADPSLPSVSDTPFATSTQAGPVNEGVQLRDETSGEMQHDGTANMQEEAGPVTQPSATNSGQEDAQEQEAPGSSGSAATDPVMPASTAIFPQAAQNRGLLGRLVRGVTPMVTYPATAVCGGVVSGVALATSPLRGTFLVAKWAGKGLLDYASLTETRQEAASSSGSAAADSSLPTTEDTSAATSSQAASVDEGTQLRDEVAGTLQHDGSASVEASSSAAPQGSADSNTLSIISLLIDGFAHLMAGRNEHALGLFSIALALHIKDARVKCILHNNTGMAYNSLGQHINAIAECHLAEAACPTVWQTYFTRAAAFDHIGLASEAVQDVRVAQAKGAVFTERQRKGVEELPFKKDCVDNCKVLGLASSHHSITEAYK
ncbi:hypothetical protein WJX82_001111 [Trebouxia sp. C0006]